MKEGSAISKSSLEILLRYPEVRSIPHKIDDCVALHKRLRIL